MIRDAEQQLFHTNIKKKKHITFTRQEADSLTCKYIILEQIINLNQSNKKMIVHKSKYIK